MPDALQLFASAFLSATLLPGSSEALLAWLATAEASEALPLICVATAGNTLGAIVNWALGRWCLHWQDRRFFPIKREALERATAWMEARGQWLLILAWVPVVGDPLTFAAGCPIKQMPATTDLLLPTIPAGCPGTLSTEDSGRVESTGVKCSQMTR